MVACPLTHTGWSLGTLRQFAKGLKSAFPRQIDWSRVYLTGDSMGGHATWMWACEDPQVFAAVAPVCGAGDPELAGRRLSKMPVWIFHGEKDPVVPVSYGKRMHEALLRVSAPVRATWYPDAGHDAWTPAWKTPELYDWFLQHTNVQRSSALDFRATGWNHRAYASPFSLGIAAGSGVVWLQCSMRPGCHPDECGV